MHGNGWKQDKEDGKIILYYKVGGYCLMFILMIISRKIAFSFFPIYFRFSTTRISNRNIGKKALNEKKQTQRNKR